MGVALTGLVFVGAVAMFGDMRLKMQERQLESAARHFMADCRMVQQGRMYIVPEYEIGGNKIVNDYKITAYLNEGYYTFDINNASIQSKKYSFADMGCYGVYFVGTGTKEILFSNLGSVDRSATITLKHRDNEDLQLTLNLQPVTGRIEIESNE